MEVNKATYRWTCVIVIPQHCIRFFILYYLIIYHIPTESFEAGLNLNLLSENFPEFLTNSQRWFTSGLLWKNGRELTSDLIELLVC